MHLVIGRGVRTGLKRLPSSLLVGPTGPGLLLGLFIEVDAHLGHVALHHFVD